MIAKAIHRIRRFTRRRDIPTETLLWLHEWQKKGLTDLGDYLEFGCFSGRSSVAFYQALRTFYKNNIPPNRFHMYLFDSFEGLPASELQADKHQQWEKGAFDVGGVDAFKSILVRNHVPLDRITLVPGYYETSLKNFHAEKLRKASFIYMDCDYYSSTKAALNFCKPYVQNFTIVYFDDLHAFSGNPHKGQWLSIHEFNSENKDMGLTLCPVLDHAAPGRLWWFWKKDL